MTTAKNKRVPGARVPLSEIKDRGQALRLLMLSHGISHYAARLVEWNKAWKGDAEIQDRIRQIGLGRGHAYDLEVLEICETVAARKLAAKAKKANPINKAA